jgi:hypothetical protein
VGCLAAILWLAMAVYRALRVRLFWVEVRKVGR